MANHFDKIFKENMEAVYLAFSKRFINTDFINTEELSTDIQRTKENKTDFLRKIIHEESSRDFILHIEAQSKDERNMHLRMMEYHAMLVKKYEMKVIQLVFYFGKGISKMQKVYDDGTNYYQFNLISVQEFSYRTFLETARPEELILAILTDFEGQDQQKVADQIFAKAKRITNETFSMEKFVNQIEILSKLRNLDNFIKQYFSTMALELKIEDTFTYKEGRKIGKDEVIIELLKQEKLSMEEIAVVAKVSLDHVKTLAKKLKA